MVRYFFFSSFFLLFFRSWSLSRFTITHAPLTLKRCPNQTIDGSIALLTPKGAPIPPICTSRTDKVYMPQENTREARMNQSSSQKPVRLESRRAKRTPTTAVTNTATGVRTCISHGSPRTCEPEDMLRSVSTLVVSRQSGELKVLEKTRWRSLKKKILTWSIAWVRMDNCNSAPSMPAQSCLISGHPVSNKTAQRLVQTPCQRHLKRSYRCK